MVHRVSSNQWLEVLFSLFRVRLSFLIPFRPSAFSKGSNTDFALRNCKVNVIVVKPDSLTPEMHETGTVVIGVRGTLELDAKVVAQAKFLVGPHDKLMLYHCKQDDVSVADAKKRDAGMEVGQVTCAQLSARVLFGICL
jgi:hypothetical protein